MQGPQPPPCPPAPAPVLGQPLAAPQRECASQIQPEDSEVAENLSQVSRMYKMVISEQEKTWW